MASLGYSHSKRWAYTSWVYAQRDQDSATLRPTGSIRHEQYMYKYQGQKDANSTTLNQLLKFLSSAIMHSKCV